VQPTPPLIPRPLAVSRWTLQLHATNLHRLVRDMVVFLRATENDTKQSNLLTVMPRDVRVHCSFGLDADRRCYNLRTRMLSIPLRNEEISFWNQKCQSTGRVRMRRHSLRKPDRAAPWVLSCEVRLPIRSDCNGRCHTICRRSNEFNL
jgi:hypothetical protein